VRQHNLRRLGYDNLDQWLKNERHVYVGRNVERYAPRSNRRDGKKWANPYAAEKYGRRVAIEKYERHIRGLPHLDRELARLKGKTLGCWCHPLPCHADVLIKLLAEGKN